MISEEGGGSIESTTLFGKYQLCRIIGQGRSGTVWLAKHIELEEYRAIKQVPKTCTDYRQFRQEALILKSLRHPGIPIVYDLEEDEQFSYLIEEFLEGDSLYALVSDMGHFSKAMTVRYGIQICRLVYSLHIARPYPILYLDLQPKNLLLCGDTMKLVDFDHAVHLSEADRLTKRYGTIGCAAPEQYSGDTLDERTDIYAIGAVLYYMLTGQYPGEKPVYPRTCIDRKVGKVLRTCLQKDKEKRYLSVERLCEALEQILLEEKGVFRQTPLSSLTIAVAGTRPGAGVTHTAMGLATHLRDQGLSVLYEERHDLGGVRQFAACMNARADRYGIFHLKGLPMLPHYGKAVSLPVHPYQVVVQDYGADWQALGEEPGDGTLLVCAGKPWEWETTREAIMSLGNLPGLAVIYNHFCGQMRVRLPGPARDARVFLMPYYSNPLRSTKKSRAFFGTVVPYLLGENTGGGFQCFKRLTGGRRAAIRSGIGAEESAAGQHKAMYSCATRTGGRWGS